MLLLLPVATKTNLILRDLLEKQNFLSKFNIKCNPAKTKLSLYFLFINTENFICLICKTGEIKLLFKNCFFINWIVLILVSMEHFLEEIMSE